MTTDDNGSPDGGAFIREKRGETMSLGEIVSGLVGIGLLLYLTYALVFPEKF